MACMIYISFSNRKATPGEFTPVEVAVLKGRTSKISLKGEIVSTTRSMIITLLLAVFGFAFGLAGRADVSDAWAEDLTKAGFTDSVVIASPGEAPGIIMATTGSCRVRFIIDRQADEICAEVPRETGSDEPSLVRSPSLEVLRHDSRFSPCFGED